MKIKLEYDKEADAIYIYLGDAPYSYGENLDTERSVDYDAKGNSRGIELLCVSTGVVTEGLPNRAEVEKLLSDSGINVFCLNWATQLFPGREAFPPPPDCRAFRLRSEWLAMTKGQRWNGFKQRR